ncbi:uncharacterized protein [Arachis hypogaea]|uniref:uncharacterized protein isoform X2 n=1 Tax=Arachis hypogaea TaxID=3818 RepID=UPI003B21824D
MICENLDWLIVMLRNSDADIEVRKHRDLDRELFTRIAWPQTVLRSEFRSSSYELGKLMMNSVNGGFLSSFRFSAGLGSGLCCCCCLHSIAAAIRVHSCNCTSM